jgi:ABC-2 type transport system permease protein
MLKFKFMLRNVLTKSLQDYRWAILGWGLGIGLLVYVVYSAYVKLLGTSALSGPALTQLADQFRFFAEPIALGTPGGYVTYKYGELIPILVGIWTILAGARMVRGDEERGAMDLLLGTPYARARLLLEKVGALTIATLLIGLLIGLLTMGGMAAAKATVLPGNALLYGLDIALAALFFGLLALLLSQFMSRFAAASWAGGLMVLSFLLDGTGRTIASLSGLQRVSPLFYYQLSKPLIPSYGTNVGGMLVLVVLSAIAVAISVPLFAWRDVGRTVFADVRVGSSRVAPTTAERNVEALAAARRRTSVRAIWLQALARQRTATFWWIFALFLATGFLVILTKNVVSQVAALFNNPSLEKLLNGQNLATNAGFLAGILYVYLPLVVSIFAGVLAYRWSSDLDQGKLELVLSTPEPRWRTMLQRFIAVGIASVLAALATWVAILAGEYVTGLSLDFGHVTLSALGLLPLELVTAALVYVLSGLVGPRLVLGILSIYLAISFLIDEVRLLLNLPSWVQNISIFHQYGSPLTSAMDWGAFFGMLVAAVVLLVIAETLFTRSDVAGGTAG